MPRFARYGLCFASLVAMILLTVSARKPTADPAPLSRTFNDWDIAELAIQLNRLGVEVRMRAVPKHGPLSHSAYLTTTAKEWGDLNVLSKDSKRIQEWHGTLYCERVGEKDASHLLEQWGNHCLAIGPFVFYGDAELLQRVRSVLDPLAQPAVG